MTDYDTELEPINLSNPESETDDGSDVVDSDVDADEIGSDQNDDDNEENLHSDEELNDHDDNEDNPHSDDSSDDDQYGRTSPTSTKPSNYHNTNNPTSTYKQKKKSLHSEVINTDFNNPENTNYLEKLNNGLRDNFVIASHPESITHNYDDVKVLSQIKRNASGVIDDPKHRMIPFITKYEMTRILGVRAQQIDNGAQPTITLDNPELISGYFIAKQELSQNKLPFIIKRSFPGNGGVEYWNVCDLDVPF